MNYFNPANKYNLKSPLTVMGKFVFWLCLVLLTRTAAAQKAEEGFDFNFKPTVYAPRYFVVTEKRDSRWHREAYYLPERGMAMEGWYSDRECKTAHGETKWYHPNKTLKSMGTYRNGKKEGLWLTFGEEGGLRDSIVYSAGRQKGTGLGWSSEGFLVDSSEFDGAGNGVEVHWYADGTVSSAGRWVSDTSKNGRWTYYHPNGQLKATEDYAGGERVAAACFDESGQPLGADACVEQEAAFPGGGQALVRFIERNLKADVPVRQKAPLGQYLVVVQFIVGTDGSIEGITPLTHFGFGMEEEVERMLKRSPRWEPAQQFGKKVKAYRRQPITFVVSQG